MNENFKDFYEQQGLNFVAFFISDIHLRDESKEDILRLEKFIDHLKEIKSNASIYFLGDIFDFWFYQASPIKNQVLTLFDKLKSYNAINGEVVFFEGNHDVHLTKYFKKLGFEVVTDRKIIAVDNKKIVLEHGDLFDPEDINYLKLRKFLRTPFVLFMAKIVPDLITSAIGRFFSKKSSLKSRVRDFNRSEAIKHKFENYGQKILKEECADVFIAGHTHERLVTKVSPDSHYTKIERKDPSLEHEFHSGLVINLGSWFDRKTVLSIYKKPQSENLKSGFYLIK